MRPSTESLWPGSTRLCTTATPQTGFRWSLPHPSGMPCSCSGSVPNDCSHYATQDPPTPLAAELVHRGARNAGGMCGWTAAAECAAQACCWPGVEPPAARGRLTPLSYVAARCSSSGCPRPISTQSTTTAGRQEAAHFELAVRGGLGRSTVYVRPPSSASVGAGSPLPPEGIRHHGGLLLGNAVLKECRRPGSGLVVPTERLTRRPWAAALAQRAATDFDRDVAYSLQ